MPQFEPGVLKTAVATITVQPSGLSCEAELFLGPDEFTPLATSGRVAFISTGSQQQVRLPVIMPSAPGIYHVYLDVSAGGMMIASYVAVQDVEILRGVVVGQFVDAYMRTWQGIDMTQHVLTTPSQTRTYAGTIPGWVYLLETVTIYWQNLSAVPIRGEIIASLRPLGPGGSYLCENLIGLTPLSGFEQIIGPGHVGSVTFQVPKPAWAGVIYAKLFADDGTLLQEAPWGVGYEGEPLSLQTYSYYGAPGGAVLPGDYYRCPL